MNRFSIKFYILVYVCVLLVDLVIGFDLKKYYFLLIDSFMYSNYNKNKFYYNFYEMVLIINFKDLLIEEVIDIII